LFSLITCIISIQPLYVHIHHVKLVTVDAANMQKAFRNDSKPVSQDANQIFWHLMIL